MDTYIVEDKAFLYYASKLIEKVVSSEVVDSFRTLKLDVSLLKKLNTALLKHGPNLRFWKFDYLFRKIDYLFDEVNREALRCKMEATDENQTLTSPPFKRLITYKLQTFIEILESSIKPTLTLLSTCVKLMLDRVVSTEFINNFRRTNLDVSLLENLKTILQDIQTVLGYAEQFQHIILIVGHWPDILRNAVFELGYFFDHIKAEYEIRNATSRVLFNGVTNYKFQILIQRLQFFTSRAMVNLFPDPMDGNGGSSSKSVPHETPTSSFLDNESSIYGRDTDIKKLKHLLLSSDGDCKTGIISIVGIEGIGKTTLAKLLYNNHEVYDKFEFKVWAHVSKHFEDLFVLETMLDDLNTNRSDTSDVNNIYPKILLVLDEVSDATSIRTLLLNFSNLAETGSRIIITTQDERVVLSLQTFGLSIKTFLYNHYLRPLETEDCWSLLARHAFGVCTDQQQSNLEEIGREIAKKCHGSPFAAVALGDILRIKLSPDYWNFVLETDIWVLTGHDVLPFIQLSYHYLSTPLKQCFAYCSIFPKKSILDKNMVVQLWIAEGFVESSTDQEKVGEEYFDVLVSRLLINQQSIGDAEANFEMHDLVHDFATEVSSPSCIIMDEHNLHDKVHNLSYNRGIYDSYDKFDKLYGLNGLRTFLALPLQKKLPLCLLSNKVVHHLLPTMKQLRVLSLSNYKSITEAPNSIGDLLYLRYLNLSHTKIERLPTETCKLYYLQFLLLAGCRRLIELPEDMGKLVNLRHLDVRDTALRKMPLQLTKLQYLHTLSDFVVSKSNDGLKLAELGKFPHLHEKLSISQLQNVNDPFEADQANMKMKECIDELSLEWD